jgi:hypothetical protein
MTLVGERGPELVYLPAGTEIVKVEPSDFPTSIPHAVADRLAPRLQRQLQQALDRLSSLVSTERLEELIAGGQFDAVLGAMSSLQLGPADQAAISNLLGEVAARTGIVDDVTMAFDAIHPQALAWAERHVGELITGIDRQTMLGVRRIVTRGFLDGVPPKVLACQIERSVGLLDRQAVTLARFIHPLPRFVNGRLVEPGAAARPTDKAILRMRNRMLRSRAEMIARTETIKAGVQGKRIAWAQGVRDGRIHVETTRIIWITTPDSRLCPICAPLEGNTIAIEGEKFVATEQAVSFHPEALEGDKRTRREQIPSLVRETKPLKQTIVMDGPPAHPRCRCDIGRVHGESTADEVGSPVSPEATRAALTEQRAALERLAAQRGVTPAELERELLEHWQREIDAGDLRINVDQRAIRQIVDDGRFKNQFESNTPAGVLAPDVRLSAEAGWFGPGNNPIYGYVGGSDVASAGVYGDVQVVLKPRLRGRATVTVGDSLGTPHTIAPSPARRLGIESFDIRQAATNAEGVGHIGFGPDLFGNLARPPGWNRYVETQIHGPITMDDIARVVFTEGPTARPFDDVVEALRRLGIEVDVVP